ncbi:hypothetical protein FHS83_003615 [Rhizomicrobium palustre]|uniref:Transporter n=1 Tax=Rhizomicrobium palustre TaxID=189966 RepID=A0A846N5H4_9PROT|nr:hypothetical protein [Rhizomicrobium palustre]NIK90297.1 hypothetical protein [Rhizomicrobium palustre]
MRRIEISAGIFAALLLGAPAVADDAPFLGTDPASVMAKGEKSIQQWLVFGHGHCKESFNSFQSQTEFDYGVTDRLQVAVSLLYDWDRTHPQGEASVQTSLVGLQGEAVWSVIAPDKGPLGVAIAVDPAFNPSSRAIAFRLLFTTYVAHFENVLNINFENSWDKDGFGHWQDSSAIVFNYGLAHALNKNWTLGVEVGNEFAFNAMLGNADLGTLASTFYAGPTVQYAGETATISLGVQTQLPLSTGDHVENGYRVDAERWRVALRVSRSL